MDERIVKLKFIKDWCEKNYHKFRDVHSARYKDVFLAQRDLTDCSFHK